MKLLIQKLVYKEKNSYRNVGTERLKDSIRTEEDLVEFILEKYGPGTYSITANKRGLKHMRLIWHGRIKKDRYKREKGQLGRYIPGMDTEKTKVWHRIDSKSG